MLIYYWNFQGFSSEDIGLMGSIGVASGAMGYLAGGYIADRVGRRKVCLIGLTCTAVGVAMFLSGRNLGVYSLAYGMTSLGGSFTWPSITTLMATKTTATNMKFLYGVQGFVNQIGLTIASFLGLFGPGFLNSQYSVAMSTGYFLVFLATTVAAFAPIGYVLSVTETERSHQKLRTHFNSRMKRILLVYSFQNALIGFGAALVIPWLPVVFKESFGASDTWVASIVMLSNAVIAVGWFVVPSFANIRGSVALIAICQIASVVFLVMLPFSPALVILALVYTVRSFLMLLPSPVLNAYVMNIVSEQIRASFLSISQLAWNIADSMAYLLAGFLWANDYSSKWPFVLAGTLYVVATLIFYVYFRNVKETGDLLQVPTPSAA